MNPTPARPVRRATDPRTHVVVAIGMLALLLGASAAQAAQSRQHRFEGDLDTLLVLQNRDGGFGDLVESADGAHATAMTPANLAETVLTIRLLLAEGHDPYAVTESWDDTATSLASSSAPNALSWLHAYEAAVGADTHPADLVLAAHAYHLLGDVANAQRLGRDAVRAFHDDPARFDTAERARLVATGRAIELTITNETVHPTWIAMQTDVASTHLADLETTAWAAIAFPSDARLRAELHDQARQLMGDTADGETARETIPTDTLAQVTYAVAYTSGTDTALAAVMLADIVDRAPLGEARVLALMSEVLVYPYISRTVPSATDGVGVGVSAGSGSLLPVDDGAREAAVSDEVAASPDSKPAGNGFPLPAWAVTATVLLALTALIVVGLAYGLKKEDLHGVRKDVFEYVETHPGEHFSKIRRELGLASGTFQHHLNVLETEGWITSFKDARYKRYFVNGNRYQTLIKGKTTEEYKGKFAALKNETTREVVRYLHLNPGATQKQVAERLQLHASTVNWHARRLKQVGLLQGEKVGKEVHYSVDVDTVDKLIR